MKGEEKLVKTGIPGLDNLLGGGLPKGKATLVSGGPGTGKTILASQYIYEGITLYNEPGVIVSLDESTDSLIENLSNFDWNLQELIHKKKLIIIQLRAKKPIASENNPKRELHTGFVSPVSRFKIKSGTKKHSAAIITQQTKAKKRLLANNLSGEIPLT